MFHAPIIDVKRAGLTQIDPSKLEIGTNCLLNWRVTTLIESNDGYKLSTKNKSIDLEFARHVFLIEPAQSRLKTVIAPNWSKSPKSLRSMINFLIVKFKIFKYYLF